MRFILSALSFFTLAGSLHAIAHPQTARLACINKTDQTIALFDEHGDQIFIAPHMNTTVTLYTPGVVAWMITTAPQQVIYETRIRKDTNRLVFSQQKGYSHLIICSPELNLFNWLCMRTELGIRNFASGLSFGAVAAESDEPTYNEDQSFCSKCFCAGVTTTSLIAAFIAYKMSNLVS
jgi:hypothetical protein